MAYIVLVDDDISVLKPLTEQLESEGHKVSAFQSSLKASDFLNENDCDLAIFDIKMLIVGPLGGNPQHFSFFFC